MHLGYAAIEIEARGGQSERMEALKAVLARNDIRVEMNALDGELARLEGRSAPAMEPAKAARASATRKPVIGRDSSREEPAASPAVKPAPGIPLRQGSGGREKPIRVIGGIARSAGQERGAPRPAAGVLKTAGKALDGVAGSMATAFEGLLGGAASKPKDAEKGTAQADEKRPLDAGGAQSKAEHDEAIHREQEQQSARRQRYLREFSREVPDEKQRDAEIERDQTKGRERTRGE